jgi:hypothetical protein
MVQPHKTKWKFHHHHTIPFGYTKKIFNPNQTTPQSKPKPDQYTKSTGQTVEKPQIKSWNPNFNNQQINLQN